MNYYSTGNWNIKKSLQEVVLKGLADDSGLYMPESIPVLSKEKIFSFKKLSFQEISLELSRTFFSGDLPDQVIEDITRKAINFDAPLVHLDERISSLELFHGPTLAFKDVGARFMARMMAYLTREMDKEINVLVATSGDTGSAVANGFWNVEGISVFILYPSGLVSPLQEKQFTTLGNNITALEVDGTFDDCQRLVKTAFLERELSSSMVLTSANSINLARLLPQTFYYFNAWARSEAEKLAISVPSGNFGNLTAGLIAKMMGLPVQDFVAATNINDIVPEYLRTGVYRPRPSQPTIANAMDVGDPSNFVRILDMYGNDAGRIRKDITAYSYRDDQIRQTIKEVYDQKDYILDPHGASGYQALADHLEGKPGLSGIFIETAHPAKFLETVKEVLGFEPDIPHRLQAAMSKEKKSVSLSGKFTDFKEFLLSVR